ncbi:MAG: diacylglycerol kinase [Proteobacteria bacterium]|nr:diacylglycerol kinase [Pseudomonadota bacterium]
MNDDKLVRHKGLMRLWKATIVSMAGLKTTWSCEEAFRQEVVLAAVLIPIALFLPVSLTIKILLIGSLLLILVVELLNSAIEATIDLITKDHHPLAKNAKDMGSAAVFICLAGTFILWSVVLFSCFVHSLE